jgi:hypothetical protein
MHRRHADWFKQECIQPGSEIRSHDALAGVCSQDYANGLIDIFFKRYRRDPPVSFQAWRESQPYTEKRFLFICAVHSGISLQSPP